MADSEFIAEVRLQDSELALGSTIQALPEMSVALDFQIVADSGAYYLFFEVDGEDFEAFDAAIEADSTVSNSAVVTEGDDTRVYRMQLLATEYLVLSKAAELGMRVINARAVDGGWETRLEVPDASMLQSFRAYCIDNGVSFTTKRIYRVEDDGAREFGLTPDQEEVLLAAHDAGYFNEPRDASLQDVADTLDISSSAASGRLRRAIDSLVENTVAGG